eukprot:gene54909-64394_t
MESVNQAERGLRDQLAAESLLRAEAEAGEAVAADDARKAAAERDRLAEAQRGDAALAEERRAAAALRAEEAERRLVESDDAAQAELWAASPTSTSQLATLEREKAAGRRGRQGRGPFSQREAELKAELAAAAADREALWQECEP